MTPTTYRIVALPKLDGDTTESDQLALAQKFRDFRLLALKDAPGAFASSYAEEALRELDQTLKRLGNPKAVHFIAMASEATTSNTARTHDADTNELLNHHWLASLVLMGPEEGLGHVSAETDPMAQIRDETNANTSVDSAESSKVFRYHLNGMFVHSSARRCGTGRRLIESALAVARSKSIRGQFFICTVIVDEWNDAAIGLYERVGFHTVATEVYGEGRVALRMELYSNGSISDQVVA